MERSNRTLLEAWEQEIPSEDVESVVKLLKKIQHWYNKERLHSALGNLRPVDYYRGNQEALKEERRVKNGPGQEPMQTDQPWTDTANLTPW